MSDLVYVYAILPAGAQPAAALAARPLVGVVDRRVQVFTAGRLAAAFSLVPATFATAAPDEHDLGWLGPQAAAHDEVNERLFVEVDAMLPLAFGTIFRGEDAITRLLETEQETLVARLDRVRGQSEWVVTVQRERERALVALDQHSALLQRLRAHLADAGPGRTYLLQRQIEQARHSELARQDGAVLHDVLDAMEALATRIYDEAIPAEAAGTTVARLSVLVPRRMEADWRARVEQVAHDWQPAEYMLRVTGPWPPYRFCALPEEGLRAAG